MNRFTLALIIFAVAGAGFFALSNAAAHLQPEFQACQAAWQTATQKLVDVRAKQAALDSKMREFNHALQEGRKGAFMDPALIDLILTNGLRTASLEMQDKMLDEIGRSDDSVRDYVLVSKAALKNFTLKPLEVFPRCEKLTAVARGVLAITPGEQQPVEAAFAQSFDEIGSWAQTHLQREEPSNSMVVGYTLPVDLEFEPDLTNKLFTSITATLGEERAALLRTFFQCFRIREDGSLGAHTNSLFIYRNTGDRDLTFRAGESWSLGPGAYGQAMNTLPHADQRR